MIKTLTGALAFATLALSTPAAAVTINLSGPNSSINGSPDGNIRNFSGSGINVHASGWSYNGSTLQNAWLGQFTSGLGVTNQGETGGSNSHTVDNSGYQDFILLVFDQAVNISSATLVPFSVGGETDNDAWVSYANLAGAYGSNPTTGSGVWALLAANDWNVPGAGSPYNVSLNSAGLFGNVWLIGAGNPGSDNYTDGFKLSAINVTTQAVPEPGTWAMMLLGFGAAGVAMRRRRTPKLAQLA